MGMPVHGAFSDVALYSGESGVGVDELCRRFCVVVCIFGYALWDDLWGGEDHFRNEIIINGPVLECQKLILI